MRRIRSLTVLAAFALGACYHATIETGRPAGTEVIQQNWAMSFVYGLVPPPVVETASKCPNGVSRVETQHSFLNILVYVLTGGIVTPITITVTCAARGSASVGAPTVNIVQGESAVQAFQRAVELAKKTDAPVYVQF